MSKQWKAVPEDKPWAILDETGSLIGTFREEHASLIAAAPDMYEALEMVISYLGLPEEFQEGEEILYWKVTNSLKKAKGDLNG